MIAEVIGRCPYDASFGFGQFLYLAGLPDGDRVTCSTLHGEIIVAVVGNGVWVAAFIQQHGRRLYGFRLMAAGSQNHADDAQ